MKVTHVNHHYLPMYGGLEYYTHRLCESLVGAGYRSDVVTTDESLSGAAVPTELDGVTYCRTDASLLRNPFSLELFRHLRESDADVYHLHSPWTLSSLEAVFALPPEVPVVVTVHGFQPFTSLFARLVSRAYRPFAQRVFDRCDAIIVLGETEAARLHREFDVPSEKVVVIPNGIGLDEVNVAPDVVDAFRAKHGLDPATPTILFVGRLVPEKNPGLLVEALAGPLADVDCQALVIGAGDEAYAERLHALADDRIRFASGLPREELLAAYQVSDVFTLLSVSEGLPTVVLEAMHAELPVVTTPVGALPDFVTDDHGAVVPVAATPDALAAALRPFLTDVDHRETVGARNRELVHERFDWDRIAGDIEALYIDLVAARASTEDALTRADATAGAVPTASAEAEAEAEADAEAELSASTPTSSL
jgi:glycosyltransferase involved in cell wall biosynthesis